MVIVPLAYKKVPYDTMKDFVPIQVPVFNFPALVVHPIAETIPGYENGWFGFIAPAGKSRAIECHSCPHRDE